VLIHEADGPMLTSAASNLSLLSGSIVKPGPAEKLLQDGDRIQVGTLSLEVLHTPGHTSGSICLLTEGKVFTGDTLFAGSVGRTDLPGGSWAKLMESLKTRLCSLDDEVEVYPGHGPPTTMGQEKRTNPFLT